MLESFKQRSRQLERIDTGTYTPEEYEQFLIDIRLVNRFAGDNRALARSLFRDIKRENQPRFSVLDVGAGSGELLRACARFARNTGRESKLVGLELNRRSSVATLEESERFKEVSSVQGDALSLPFGEGAFDYVICSLFTHHFDEKEIDSILKNMARVAKKKIFVIDLERHPGAYLLYKIFCLFFVKGSLVKSDGALSILRGFRPSELEKIASDAELGSPVVRRHFPFRLVLEASGLKN